MKNSIKIMKIQATDWKKIVTKTKPNKGLISRIQEKVSFEKSWSKLKKFSFTPT